MAGDSLTTIDDFESSKNTVDELKQFDRDYLEALAEALNTSVDNISPYVIEPSKAIDIALTFSSFTKIGMFEKVIKSNYKESIYNLSKVLIPGYKKLLGIISLALLSGSVATWIGYSSVKNIKAWYFRDKMSVNLNYLVIAFAVILIIFDLSVII